MADDLMEVEKVQNISNTDRICLGPVDQNLLRNVTVESENILKYGIGKWKKVS